MIMEEIIGFDDPSFFSSRQNIISDQHFRTSLFLCGRVLVYKMPILNTEYRTTILIQKIRNDETTTRVDNKTQNDTIL